MTTEAILSRERLLDLEPEEIDATGKTWLSGYAIPTSVSALVQAGGIARFEFRYPTSDLKAEEPVLIDDEKPGVAIAFSSGIRRVLAVHFFPRVLPVELSHVVERLVGYASREPMVAKKLSVRLVASLIQEAASGRLWDWPLNNLPQM